MAALVWRNFKALGVDGQGFQQENDLSVKKFKTYGYSATNSRRPRCI